MSEEEHYLGEEVGCMCCHLKQKLEDKSDYPGIREKLQAAPSPQKRQQVLEERGGGKWSLNAGPGKQLWASEEDGVRRVQRQSSAESP